MLIFIFSLILVLAFLRWMKSIGTGWLGQWNINVYDQSIESLKRVIEYTCKTEQYLYNLSTEASRLHTKMLMIQQEVDQKKREGEAISMFVETWLTVARNLYEESSKFIKETDRKWRWMEVPHRYNASVRAVKLLDRINEEMKGGEFEKVTARNSRELLLTQILEALRKKEVRAVGIYGKYGTGKTTLGDKVIVEARNQSLFDIVIKVVVSLIVDMKRIQDDIARGIGMSFQERSSIITREDIRAAKLQERLEKELQDKKILIFLDSLWAKLDCRKIGIPKGCKIIITTAVHNVCSKMDAEEYKIHALEYTETWSLFRYLEPEYCQLAFANSGYLKDGSRKLVRFCKGWPLALKVLLSAATMNGGNTNLGCIQWKKVADHPLLALHYSDLINLNVQNLITKVVQVSFDFMECEEMISFLRFCSFFPGDSAIIIEELVRYGIGLALGLGLDLFKSATLKESIQCANKWAERLEALNLILYADFGHHRQAIRMHNLLRFSVRSNFFDLEKRFRFRWLFDQESWPDYVREYAISITLSTPGVRMLASYQKCTNLCFLRLECVNWRSNFLFDDSYFDTMSKLKVLDIRNVHFLDQQRPQLGSLTSLKALSLHKCTGLDRDLTTIMAALTSLEILSLRGSDISEVPEGFRQLTNLRLLDLTNCKKIVKFPSNVLSSFTKLEGLYMFASFNNWNTEDGASLSELSLLNRLQVLQVRIQKIAHLPGDLPFDVLSFAINTGHFSFFFDENRYGDLTHCYSSDCKVLELQNLNVDIMVLQHRTLALLLSEAEELQLYQLKSLKSINHLSFEGSKNWRNITTESCDDMDYVINPITLESPQNSTLQEALSKLERLELRSLPSLQGIWPERANIDCGNLALVNLKVLYVYDCHKLQCLLKSPSLLLPSLESLGIWYCSSLEHIFVTTSRQEDLNDQNIALPRLQHLKICRARRIKTFSVYASTNDDNSESLFCKKDRFPELSSLEIIKMQVKELWDRDQMVPDYVKLETVRVSWSPFLKTVVPFSLLNNLVNLKILDISYCDGVEDIFEISSPSPQKNVSVPLREFMLRDLYHLRHINLKEYMVKSLLRVSIRGCHSLKFLFSADVVKSLSQLKHLDIAECHALEAVYFGYDDQETIVQLPELRQLMLHSLHNLRKFCTGAWHLEFPKLDSLEIIDCPELETFSSRPVDAPKLSFVNLGDGNYSWEGDLNTTIQQHFEKQAFANGKRKKLSHEDKEQLIRQLKEAEEQLKQIEKSVENELFRRCIYSHLDERQQLSDRIINQLHIVNAIQDDPSLRVLKRKIKARFEAILKEFHYTTN